MTMSASQAGLVGVVAMSVSQAGLAKSLKLTSGACAKSSEESKLDLHLHPPCKQQFVTKEMLLKWKRL